MISQQTTNNEIAIPTIHFIELTTRDDVRIFEIEQAVSAHLAEFPQAGDSAGQALHSNGAVLLQFAQSGRARKIGGEKKDRVLVWLNVRQGFALRHRARQIVPAGRNVSKDIGKRLGAIRRARCLNVWLTAEFLV